MTIPENHLMLIAPWGPVTGENRKDAITNASSTTYGPFEVGEAVRFSSDIDFHYVMAAASTGTDATTSHQVQRSNWYPLELTIQKDYEYISVIGATTTGSLWSAPIHPAINKNDKDEQ